MAARDEIFILDFGSQYNQLIARRVREKNVFCRIVGHDTPASEIKKLSPKGIILSGGPASIYDPKVPRPDEKIFQLNEKKKFKIKVLLYWLCYFTEYCYS